MEIDFVRHWKALQVSHIASASVLNYHLPQDRNKQTLHGTLQDVIPIAVVSVGYVYWYLVWWVSGASNLSSRPLVFVWELACSGMRLTCRNRARNRKLIRVWATSCFWRLLMILLSLTMWEGTGNWMERMGKLDIRLWLVACWVKPGCWVGYCGSIGGNISSGEPCNWLHRFSLGPALLVKVATSLSRDSIDRQPGPDKSPIQNLSLDHSGLNTFGVSSGILVRFCNGMIRCNWRNVDSRNTHQPRTHIKDIDASLAWD